MPYSNSRDDRRQELIHFSERSKELGDRRGCDFRHLLDLDREFPGVDMFGPQSIGVHCGQGWANIVRDAVAAISAVGGRIGQIKQKFGGLRIYWDPPEDLRRTRLKWIEGGKQGPDPFDGSLYRAAVYAVDVAEAASFGICEHCGASIVPPRGESHQTLCNECM